MENQRNVPTGEKSTKHVPLTATNPKYGEDLSKTHQSGGVEVALRHHTSEATPPFPAENSAKDASLEDSWKIARKWKKVLAKYNHRGVVLVASLTKVEVVNYGKEDLHLITMELTFMNPFSSQRRIRGAQFSIKLTSGDFNNGHCKESSPELWYVKPNALLLEFSEREVSSGGKISFGGTANGGMGGMNVNVESSKGETTRFKGARLIQGVVESPCRACWRIYEELGSKSGVPQTVTIMAAIHSNKSFMIEVDEFQADVHDIFRFWKMNTIKATPMTDTKIDSIPDLLSDMRKFEELSARKMTENACAMVAMARGSMAELQTQLDASFNSMEPITLVKKGVHVQRSIRLIQEIQEACKSWLHSASASGDTKSYDLHTLLQYLILERRMQLRDDDIEDDQLFEVNLQKEASIKHELHDLEKEEMEMTEELAIRDGQRYIQEMKAKMQKQKGNIKEFDHGGRKTKEELRIGHNYRKLKEKILQNDFDEARIIPEMERERKRSRSRSWSPERYWHQHRSRSQERYSHPYWTTTNPNISLGMRDVTQSQLDDFSPVGKAYRVLKLA